MTGRIASDLARDLESRLRRHRPRRKSVRREHLDAIALSFLGRVDEEFVLEGEGDRWLDESERLASMIMKRRTGDVLVQIDPPRGSADENRSVLRTCLRDQPFVVDSIRLCLQQHGLGVMRQVNLLIPIQRDESGVAVAIGGRATDDKPLESLTYFEIDPIEDAEQRKALREDIRRRLVHARAAVGDFRKMLRQLKDLENQLEYVASLDPNRREQFDEARQLLEWLGEDNFVFFGMTRVGLDGKPEGERLGLDELVDDPFAHSYPDTKKFLRGGRQNEVIRVDKTAAESELHRRGKVDEIVVRVYDDRGAPRGCVAIHGLFTFRAIQARGSIVPILRQKLNELVRREDVTPGSYNYKSIVNAFNALPVEYLFGAEIDDILDLVRHTLQAQREEKLGAHVSLGPARRSAFVFVVMPRQNYSDGLRERIQRFLQKELGANYGDHRVLMSSYGVAVLHYYLTSARKMTKPDLEALERGIVDLSATWSDRLRQKLLEEFDRADALALYREYHAAFSPRFQVSTDAVQAVRDIAELEALQREPGVRAALFRDREDQEQGTVKLRLYAPEKLILSDVMPTLENFGLRVVNSFTNHARLGNDRVFFLETFRFENPIEGFEVDAAAQQDFLDALGAVLSGAMANDALNRVLIPAGLRWQQVVLLRSYQGYAKQLGLPMTPQSVWPVLVAHADITRLLVEFFEARFGPDARGRISARPSSGRRKLCAKLQQEIYDAIDRVQGFNEDRMLRIFANLIASTLRTSAYSSARVHNSIAHKIDCTAVTSMSDPRPWREIYVHHRNLEGVHLRGGRIARGGLRWSDRLDDFRTEILGLMTTQMVKNVVIVPLGAKGGFVVKELPTDPQARRAAGDAHYEIFIHGLLDVTDNNVGGETVPPAEVVCWDDPDPYLVVAADKGTAHLSDTANRISRSRGFWLDDAFASGGSNGYDHKAIGITARGAWVCIRHHLRELGIDATRDEFSVVGIGDMGGDVFGNGLIEHPKSRLLAAFNHMHIFLDPDPDTKVAYAERKRLFKARYGGWGAYDPKKISRGGGVFDRHAKSIPLSAPVRKMLGTERTEMSGNELVHAILQMPVDLWYNGGIGTYVKASHETHAHAADAANDAVRIDATQLRAKVVGEGGNLGLTQAARIEFARRGGKINTDFIDNAGGVNISDHEVNLKILFAPLVAEGRLRPAARNRLLKDVEPQVTADVLEANGDQARMVSLDERRSAQDLAAFDRVIDEVCRHYGHKRSDLHLPPVREMDRRMAAGEALSRPELATLSAWVKMQLYEQLLEDDSLAMEGLLPAVRNYFPENVRKRFTEEIDQHSLRREIALTRLTNRIVDHTGCTFFHEMQTDCNAAPRRTFEAYSLLNRAADLWVFKDALWELRGKVEVEVLYEALLRVEDALRLGTRHLLEHWTDERISEALRSTGGYSKKLQTLALSIDEVLDPLSLERVEAAQQRYREAQVPAAMARRLAQIRHLPRALVVLDLAEVARKPVAKVAADYFSLGRASGLFGLMRWIDEQRPGAYYDALALRALRRELHELLSRLVLRLLPVKGSAEAKIASLGAGGAAFARVEQIPPDQLGPAALLVLTQEMRQSLGGA